MPRWRSRLDAVRLDPRSLQRRLREERTRLAGLSRQLEALGPRQVQERGYALVEARDGSSGVLVKRASEVSALAGTRDRLSLNLRFADGDLPVEWRKPNPGTSSA